MILAHLRERGSITSKEAIDTYGITRLSGRIYDLRRMGNAISASSEKVLDRFGSERRVARYRLEGYDDVRKY